MGILRGLMDLKRRYTHIVLCVCFVCVFHHAWSMLYLANTDLSLCFSTFLILGEISEQLFDELPTHFGREARSHQMMNPADTDDLKTFQVAPLWIWQSDSFYLFFWWGVEQICYTPSWCQRFLTGMFMIHRLFILCHWYVNIFNNCVKCEVQGAVKNKKSLASNIMQLVAI